MSGSKNDSTKLRFRSAEHMLDGMNELDELMSAKLVMAIENARASGRQDIADYLALKAANDSIRNAETDKLFKAFIGIALEDENAARNIEVERESPHIFIHRNANLKGALLRLTRGLRCLTVETGWTRTPDDGFMRLGALAFARISHLGLPERNSELMLKLNEGSHLWFEVRLGMAAEPFEIAGVEHHLEIFLNDRLR